MKINLADYQKACQSPTLKIERKTFIDHGHPIEEAIADMTEAGEFYDFGFDVSPPDPTEAEARLVDIYNLSPSDFAETAINIAYKGCVNSFDFSDRPYLKRIYDTSAKKVLLMSGRQVEKCLPVDACVRKDNGFPLRLDQVQEGSYLMSFDTESQIMGHREVKWVSKLLRKACLRLITQTGQSLRAAKTHPVLTPEGWKQTGDLRVGDSVACVARGGVFTGLAKKKNTHIWVTASYLNRGHRTRKEIILYEHGEKRFNALKLELEWVGVKPRSCLVWGKHDVLSRMVIPGDSRVTDWLDSDGFPDKRGDKKMPGWVYDLSRHDTALFLEHLFSANGWCEGKPISFRSKNQRLIREVQALLWKFHIRTLVHVEPPQTTWVVSVLPEYAPIFVGEIVLKTEQVQQGSQADIFWDPIFDISDVGYLQCLDISIEGTENFVADGCVTHNSTTLGNRILSYSCLNNHFRSLYVSSSAEQTRVFSRDRVHEPIEVSPILKAYTSRALTNAVFHKKFLNYSQIVFRSAYLNADRCRGIPSDLIALDELQDVILDNIPVIEECASHSAYKLFLYSGTPKSLDNAIETYWSTYSTQCEWVVPCQRHGTPKDPSSWHWNVLGENNIGKTGVVCDRCFEPIDVHHPLAQWAAMQPITNSNKEVVTFEGYRVPQLLVPWIAKSDTGWSDLLEKVKRYSRQRLNNEVLGISFDSGVRPITREQLRSCCHPEIRMSDFDFFKSYSQNTSVFAGIDWGSGENTYTVISLGAYLGTGIFTVFWTHRFEGAAVDPEIQLEEISRILTQFNVRTCGCDYGGGFYCNNRLMHQFGPQRIVKYQYADRTVQGKVFWQPDLGRFIVHRSEVMSSIFSALKRNLIALPCWEEFEEPYGNDILSIFTEFNERTRQNRYDRTPNHPDDTFHSILYLLLASMLHHPRQDILEPGVARENAY